MEKDRTYRNLASRLPYALSRMTSVTQEQQAGGATVAYKRVELVYNPLDQFQTVRRYTSASATVPAVTSEYDLYDERARLGRLRHLNASTVLATYTWLYDAGDRITRMTSNDGTVTYSHDATNQLTAADHSGQDDEGYSYDRNGNRTGAFEAAAPNRVTTYVQDADITYTYAYDYEGNRISRTKLDKGVWRSTWSTPGTTAIG